MATSKPMGLKGAGTGLALGTACGLILVSLDLPSMVSYWGDRVPLVAAAAVLGAFAWGTPARRPLVAFALLLGVVWSLVAATPIAGALARDLPRRDPPRPADAIFVFSSRVQANGDLTAASMSRLLHGLELLAEGKAPRLILSEQEPSRPRRSYGAAAHTLMDHLGLQAELITVGPVASTHDEAMAVGALCREKGWGVVLAVTSPLHSRRAAAALEAQGLQVVSSPAMEIRYDLEDLSRGDDRILVFGNALHEWIGLWVYTRRGWLSPSPAR